MLNAIAFNARVYVVPARVQVLTTATSMQVRLSYCLLDADALVLIALLLPAAARLGLKVVRVPAYSPASVAEHAVTLMLALNRNLRKASDGDHWACV